MYPLSFDLVGCEGAAVDELVEKEMIMSMGYVEERVMIMLVSVDKVG